MPYHFVAPNGIGKNKKVSLFFLKLRPILEVSFLELSYSWQLSQSVTFEDKMPLLRRQGGCIISHLDAFPEKNHHHQESHGKGQHGHWQAKAVRLGEAAGTAEPTKSGWYFFCVEIYLHLWMYLSTPLTHLQNGIPHLLQNGGAWHWHMILFSYKVMLGVYKQVFFYKMECPDGTQISIKTDL